MDPSSPVADITSFYIQEIGAVLFGTAFYFLYRQSRVVYFGLWAVAWGLRVLATFFGFQLLRTHTIEGMFSDPMHGGNAGLIGWQMIGYPGPQMSYRNEIDKHFGQPYRPKPQSLQQIMGRAPQPWEDEKD